MKTHQPVFDWPSISCLYGDDDHQSNFTFCCWMATLEGKSNCCVKNLSQLSIIHHFLPYLLASKSRPPPPWDQKPYMYKIQCTTRGDNSGLHMPKLPNTNLWLCRHVMADLVSEGAGVGGWGGEGGYGV